MKMHNPPHPGEFIVEVYLEPNNLSGRELAAKLGVSASTLSRILNGSSGATCVCPLRRRDLRRPAARLVAPRHSRSGNIACIKANTVR